MAISVDTPAQSRAMIRRMGLTFTVASDADQGVQKAFGVQNPATKALALHAVYILNEKRQVIYRKVASRRPRSQELLDAIDFYRGVYPMGDDALTYSGTEVAFPKNNFQALIEVATSRDPLPSIDKGPFANIKGLVLSGELDEATLAYRALMSELAPDYTERALLDIAAWLAKSIVELPEEALLAGLALNQALLQQRQLDAAPDPQSEAALQKDLDTLRTTIRKHRRHWQLDSLKTTLRGYREISLAAKRSLKSA